MGQRSGVTECLPDPRVLACRRMNTITGSMASPSQRAAWGGARCADGKPLAPAVRGVQSSAIAHRLLLHLSMFAMLATLSGCRGGHSTSAASSIVAAGADRPGVVRIDMQHSPNARIQGSMTPVGDGMALTALHILRQPVGRVDGTLTGLDAQVSGRAPDTGAEDWVMVRVNDAKLPDAAPLVADHPTTVGDAIYLFGFPSRSGEPNDAVRVGALVADPPAASGHHPELIFLRVDGDPDLGGMSGGPACVRDREGRWVVVGLYVGRWDCWPWRTCYVVRRLPREALARLAHLR